MEIEITVRYGDRVLIHENKRMATLWDNEGVSPQSVKDFMTDCADEMKRTIDAVEGGGTQ